MQENVIDARGLIDAVHPGLPDDAARFAQVFGRVLYVHLSRHDKVAQAVSRVKAEQTGLWHAAPDGTELERTRAPAEPRYDFEEIDRRVAELENHDRAWIDWFTGQGLNPHAITYEELSENPAHVLSDILTLLGRDPACADGVLPQVAKLSDAVSAAWITRYKADKTAL